MCISHDTSGLIGHIAGCAIPVANLVSPRRSTVTADEQNVLCSASTIGLNLAYDGSLYLRDLVVVDDGGWILWKVLRFALLNHLREVEKRVRDDFATSRDGASRHRDGPFDDAARWLHWLETDAGIYGRAPLVPPPKDVEERLDRARRTCRRNS